MDVAHTPRQAKRQSTQRPPHLADALGGSFIERPELALNVFELDLEVRLLLTPNALGLMARRTR